MNPHIYHDVVIPAAEKLFPEKFITTDAKRLIIAICYQETKFQARQQLIGSVRDWWKSEKGPAAGYPQFERIGVRGVLEHRASDDLVNHVLVTLGYPRDVETIFKALIHNDLLGAAFARLALWRLPQPLPKADQEEEGYRQYIEVWQPGKRRAHEWPHAWRMARMVLGEN